MRPLGIAALPMIVVGMSACHRRQLPVDQGVAVGPVLHRHLLAKAGKDAIDCGWSGDEASFAAMNACALKASKHAKPFFVQFRVHGIDSIGQVGFVLTPDHALVSYGQEDGDFFPGEAELIAVECVSDSLEANEFHTLSCKPNGVVRTEKETTYASHFYSSRR